MKNATKIFCFIIFNLFAIHIFSQDLKTITENKTNQNFTLKSVPRGGKSLAPEPSADSECFKIKIEFNRDFGIFMIKDKEFENGILKDSIFFNNTMATIPIKKNGYTFFEMIPDVSLSTKMTLFIYFPVMTSFSYMYCSDGYKIYYRRFMDIDNSKTETIPLILFYIDNDSKTMEKIINNYTKDNLITITSIPELKTKIIDKMTHCKLIYYTLTQE